MNTKSILAIAAFATIATGAFAQEADLSGQFAQQVQSTRTRAEVQAEAATVSATRTNEPAGMRAIAVRTSGQDVKTVRAEAAQANRLGQIQYGEASL